jgi:hypothetical protein
MAVYQNKHIILVFFWIDDVPQILRIETGVDASSKNVDEIADSIYRIISNKFQEEIKK